MRLKPKVKNRITSLINFKEYIDNSFLTMFFEKYKGQY